MRRRTLLSSCALPAWAGLARAQPALPRLGVLHQGPAAGNITYHGVLKRLETLGWTAGSDYTLVPGFAEGRPERLPELAAELVRQKVDVILAFTNFPVAEAQRATRSIPIVGWAMHGALETGLATNLARPGGNLTGLDSLATDTDAKRVQLLRQVAPAARKVAVFCNPDDAGTPVHMRALEAAGQPMGLRFSRWEARVPTDVDPLLAAAERDPPDAIMELTSTVVFLQWRRVCEFALARRVPTVAEFREMLVMGSLLSYGATFAEFHEVAARQVDRILRGRGTPAEMPIERPTRFELLLNRKVAAAIGVTLPRELLLRADEVIE